MRRVDSADYGAGDCCAGSKLRLADWWMVSTQQYCKEVHSTDVQTLNEQIK